MKHGSLFSGIGGFDLASEWMGWDNVFHCEYNDFSQKVLKYYWPKAISYGDIKQTDFSIHRGEIDILTGGFPCQPYSLAGKRKGKEDERHLWPEMLRAIREIQPTYVVGENVFGLINWSGGLVFDEVQADLEAEGYEVWAYVLPACAVNAPHRRDRIWFVAYSRHNAERTARSCSNDEGCKPAAIHPKGQRRERQAVLNSGLCDLQGNDNNTDCDGCEQCNGQYEKYTSERWVNALNDFGQIAMHTNNTRLEGCQDKGETKREGQRKQQFTTGPIRTGWENFPTQSPICGGNDGISSELVGITFPKWRNESIKAFGNAIVPAVAFQIFKAIEEFNQSQ